MKNEDMTEDTWKEYPNNHGFHLRCDLEMIKRRVQETVEWIAAVPSTRERVRLLTELKDGIEHLVNVRNSWFWPGIQQLRYAAIYEHFVTQWHQREQWEAQWEHKFDHLGDQQWDEIHGRSWRAASDMTHVTNLNIAQIRKIVEKEANRRRQEAAQALREHQKAKAESGLPRPVREIEQ